MNVFFHTFGCRANQYDTELVRQAFTDLGAVVVDDPAEADLAVINSCTVTHTSEAKLRSLVRRVSRNSRSQTIVMGCAATLDDGTLAALPGVRAVVAGAEPATVLRAAGYSVARPDPVLRRFATNARAWLKIQDGCDEHCTFCATTIARGANRSRPVAELIEEARALAEHHAEIVLTGVHIGTYGRDWAADPGPVARGHITDASSDLEKPGASPRGQITDASSDLEKPGASPRSQITDATSDLEKPGASPQGHITDATSDLEKPGASPQGHITDATSDLENPGASPRGQPRLGELLEALITAVPTVRFRLSSIEATEVDDRIAHLLMEAPRNLAPHLHAPLQSGSDRVLRRMGRHWYTAHSYRDRLEWLAERLPVFGLGADVIAGFPGESDADHRATVELIEQLPFTYLHVFPFSVRPDAPAARLRDMVPATVIHERARELRELGEAKHVTHQTGRCGACADGVVSGHQGGRLDVLTEDYLSVYFSAEQWDGSPRFPIRVE